ncbi:MAG: hypothetical protein WCK57_12220 [Verrucomicrobiae bacterium]
MADTTPTPTPTPAPAPKTKVQRRDTNQEIVDELANAKAVAAAAVDPANAPSLAEVELDATLPSQIIALAAKITGDLAKLKTARVARKMATAQETAARDALIAVLQPIQVAARRKFKGPDATQREAYYIGANLSAQSLDDVLIAAGNVIARLTPGENNAPPQDVLPGIKANGAIKDLADAIAEYTDDNAEQGDQQKKSSGTLEAIWADVAVLAGLRRDVQLAADQAWPWRKAGVATIRKTFLLPANQPLKD